MVYDTIRYIICQYCTEPVLIKQILIGFEAILENISIHHVVVQCFFMRTFLKFFFIPLNLMINGLFSSFLRPLIEQQKICQFLFKTYSKIKKFKSLVVKLLSKNVLKKHTVFVCIYNYIDCNNLKI